MRFAPSWCGQEGLALLRHGAGASANLYSLIETAKANGLEPYAYLRRIFEELPKAATLAEVELLLPHQIKLGPSPEVKS